MTAAGVPVDLDDTAACPLAAACEGPDCPVVEDLAVATVETVFGVHCSTLCTACAAAPLPGLAPLEALTRAGRHAEHLGVDVDVVVAALDVERGGR